MSIKLLRIPLQFCSNLIRRLIWLTQNSKKANLSFFKVHLLVVNNTFYARLAQTCVESFLFFHPNSQIIIHYDYKTEKELIKRFKAVALLRKNKVNFELVNENSVWQLHKLHIILGMQGTYDFFMDCDLRWNGSIQDKNEDRLIFFLEERVLVSYEEIYEAMQKKLAPYTNTSMKNTSFFSWSGVKILESQCQHIVDLWAELYENTLNQTSIQSQSVSRISEQVVLSLVPRLFGLPFSFLKDSDKQFDGSICESSYYGASGGRFALWGNTNRKPWF